MIEDLEARIRERAHSIWEREGRPADRASAHWFMASEELTAEGALAPAKPRAKRKPALAEKAAAPARRSKKAAAAE
jgi:hypothetical protein